jgi:alkanesulfonate monooxygenase SsuD/methylene tetrahydromethanopterin reductase-like flavin-dependent oxidoreductase (luciferase family)
LYDLVDKLDIYLEEFTPNEANRNPKIALSLPLLICNDQNEAEMNGDEYLSEYIRVWADAADSWNTSSSSNYPGYTGMSYALRQNSPKNMKDTNQAIIGTPDFVAQKINEIIKLNKIDQILWQIDFGGQKLESMRNTLMLFVNKVLPQLKNKG